MPIHSLITIIVEYSTYVIQIFVTKLSMKWMGVWVIQHCHGSGEQRRAHYSRIIPVVISVWSEVSCAGPL